MGLAKAGVNDATAVVKKPDRLYNICNKQEPLSGEKDSPEDLPEGRKVAKVKANSTPGGKKHMHVE